MGGKRNNIMAPKVILESPDFLVINKPSGLIVHAKNNKDTSESVVSWIIENYPEIKNVGDDKIVRPGIIHRLDKETSGIMIIARTQKAFEFIKNQFQKREIKKTYITLVYGNVKNDLGTIDVPLGKIGTKQTTRIHGKKELTGKEAITDYEVIKRYKDYTLVNVYPKTGRTHQIRVHMAHIGNPVVCDPIYGGRKKICPENLGRLFLHAQKISFKNLENKKVEIETPMPKELELFIKGLSQ